ncbi:MAG: c-type cytochrome [Rhodospirillales bacterium]
MRNSLLASLLAAAALAAPAWAAGDADAGKMAFNAKCALCHTTTAGTTRLGPSLFGVVGRKAGTLPGFNYSDAMKNANRTWGDATLDAYLANPQQNLPGVKMVFAGLPDATARQNVIAYLETLK